MEVINLFGAPSAGKSTTAAGLFYRMKKSGYNCELVTEYAKSMVWREMSPKAFEDQLYITAKQHQKIASLKDKVDFVITDSPLLLGLVYVKPDYFQNYAPLLKEIFNSYNNTNILLKRNKPYNPIGRNQTEAESDEIHKTLKWLLQDYGYYEITEDQTTVDNIYSSILSLDKKPKA